MKRAFKIFVKRKLISLGYSLSRFCSFPFLKPDFLQLNLTTRCNLKCRICSFKDEDSDTSLELTVAEISKMAKQASDWKLNQIVLSGGEPFLRKDIFEILKVIKDAGSDVVITTNALLLTDDKLLKLNDTSLKHLQISIDGATKETHDYIRGEGSFLATIELVKKAVSLSERKFSVGLSFTVMPYNYREMESFLYLAKSLNVDTVLFIPVISDNSYRTLDGEKDFFNFNLSQINNVRESFLCVEKYKSKNSKPEISNFENMKNYWRYFEGIKNRWKCFAGFRWLQINPYGTAKMCGFEYDDFRNNGSLKKIWYSSSAFAARQKIKKCSLLCMQPCMSKPV